MRCVLDPADGDRHWVGGSAAWVCLALVVTMLPGCRSAVTVEPETAAETAIWDALSPELQERVAASVGSAAPLVDPEWWKIVRRTCAVNAFANCVCCAPTAQGCNPTNWQCCASAVFQPADGSSCSTPDPCRCVPPSAVSQLDDEPAAETVCRAE